MTTKQRYQERLSSGRCPNCGGENSGDTVYCQSCLQRDRERYRKNIGKERPVETPCKSCGTAIKVTNKIGGVPKYCSECKRKKSVEANRQWYKNPENKKRRNKYATNYAKVWRRKNFHAYLNTWLNRKYGISISDWISIYEKQNGCCAICKKPFPNWEDGGVIKRKIHLDHDHKTNAIRGLLCRSCNLALGLFNDSPETVAYALWYLSSF
jgi:hypothetical protein